MDNALIALANGGLCNRLKTVVSAHRIASETGRTLYVHWNSKLSWEIDGTRHYLPWPGGWRDLFAEPMNEMARDEIKHLDWMRNPTPNDWKDNVVPRDDPRPAMVKSGWRWLRYEDEPDVDYLRSGTITDAQEQVVLAIQPFLAVARPVASIKARVDRFVEAHGIGKHWTSLHVRTQHPYCRTIPFAKYLTAVNQAIAADPAVMFFLASDSLELEERLGAQYPGRIVVYPKETHDVVEGVQRGDALVDLLLLASTGRIIGSGGSTFNEFAWWLAGCSVPNQYVD